MITIKKIIYDDLGDFANLYEELLERKTNPYIIIENVIVKSSCRGMGIGKLLMSFIEDFARMKNCYFTMLVSAFRRKDSHEFYESIGCANDVVKGFKKYL